jgi:hypothetical protein
MDNDLIKKNKGRKKKTPINENNLQQFKLIQGRFIFRQFPMISFVV